MISVARVFFLTVLLSCNVAVFAAAAPAGGLAWETSEHRVTTRPGQETVSVVYPFRNATDHPVRIMTIEAGCTCTNARVAKDDYAPGERGELKVEFTLGERVGRQDRVITVVTDDHETPMTSVKLSVDIPELVVVRPRVLFWPIGSKPETKLVEIVLMHPETSRLEPPQSASPTFTMKLQSTDRPGVYRLEVTPSSTAENAQGLINLVTTVEGTKRTLAVFAAVK